jgi:hypothetical protein
MSENPNRVYEDDVPTPEDVQAKAADGEALTLQELEQINMPPARPHNDDAEIGKRFEPSNYAPAAQPDLNAPAYVLAAQAKAVADGDEDVRVGQSDPSLQKRPTKADRAAQADKAAQAEADKADKK